MNVFLLAGVALFLFMSMVFVVAMIVKDNSIVDIAYGLSFVLVCLLLLFSLDAGHPRQYLAAGLVILWGLRLAVHIFFRKKGEGGEDFRYRQWREEWGKTFVWRSYLQIFMLQGAVVFLVLSPVLLIFNAPGEGLGLLDVAGLLVWLFGFTFEALGDWQLLVFKKNPKNRGKIMQTGLWRYTRHPNYFGEATLWWGLFLIAVTVPWGVLAIASPLLIDFLLLKVSGIPMLEAKYENNPEFASYKSRTNALLPWWPKQQQEAKR